MSNLIFLWLTWTGLVADEGGRLTVPPAGQGEEEVWGCVQDTKQ
jgi:hypothetical protein